MAAPGNDLEITLGIEEEYFLIGEDSLDLIPDEGKRILKSCQSNQGEHHFVPELLTSQLEANSRICGSVKDTRKAIKEMRTIAIAGARCHGAKLLASSTHPFARWETQSTTPDQRYRRLAKAMQESARRLLVGGMHVHLGFGDPDSRIRVMTAMRSYLPIILALSASSPFSAGRMTGFKSYRTIVVGSLPRTNLPEKLETRAEYDRIVQRLKSFGAIDDDSELWWDVRPSHTFPTIEIRVCDVCTSIDDAVSIISICACVARRLLRLDEKRALPPEMPTAIIDANRWLAHRYGVFAFMGHPERTGMTDILEIVTSLVEELRDDAEALDCVAELERAIGIINEGSSADHQMDHFRDRQLTGDSEEDALRSVIEMLVERTGAGL